MRDAGARDDAVHGGVISAGCRLIVRTQRYTIVKRFLQLGIVLAAISAMACHREPTGPTLFYHGLLQSDQVSYTATVIGSGPTAHPGFTLIARYVNRSNAPIYLERCLGTDAQPQIGVQFVFADSVAFGPPGLLPGACTGTAPLAVAAGTVRTDTFTVAAPSLLPVDARIYYDVSSCGNELGLLWVDAPRLRSRIWRLPGPRGALARAVPLLTDRSDRSFSR